MDATRHNDPYAAFHFVVDFEGMKAGFSEVHGLPKEGDIEYLSKGKGTKARKLQGLHKNTNLVLKRGFTNSKELWEWRKSVTGGGTRRLSGTLTVFDEARRVASNWKFDEAWPQKWEGPAYNDKNNDVAIEELEIAVEGLSLTSPSDDPKP